MSFRIAISLSTCKRKNKYKCIIKQLAAWADLKPACWWYRLASGYLQLWIYSRPECFKWVRFHTTSKTLTWRERDSGREDGDKLWPHYSWQWGQKTLLSLVENMVGFNWRKAGCACFILQKSSSSPTKRALVHVMHSHFRVWWFARGKQVR